MSHSRPIIVRRRRRVLVCWRGVRVGGRAEAAVTHIACRSPVACLSPCASTWHLVSCRLLPVAFVSCRVAPAAHKSDPTVQRPVMMPEVFSSLLLYQLLGLMASALRAMSCHAVATVKLLLMLKYDQNCA